MCQTFNQMKQSTVQTGITLGYIILPRTLFRHFPFHTSTACNLEYKVIRKYFLFRITFIHAVIHKTSCKQVRLLSCWFFSLFFKNK